MEFAPTALIPLAGSGRADREPERRSTSRRSSASGEVDILLPAVRNALATILSVIAALVVASYAVAVVRGEEAVRDQRGRLRPAFALIAIALGVTAIALVTELLVD